MTQKFPLCVLALLAVLTLVSACRTDHQSDIKTEAIKTAESFTESDPPLSTETSMMDAYSGTLSFSPIPVSAIQEYLCPEDPLEPVPNTLYPSSGVGQFASSDGQIHYMTTCNYIDYENYRLSDRFPCMYPAYTPSAGMTQEKKQQERLMIEQVAALEDHLNLDGRFSRSEYMTDPSNPENAFFYITQTRCLDGCPLIDLDQSKFIQSIYTISEQGVIRMRIGLCLDYLNAEKVHIISGPEASALLDDITKDIDAQWFELSDQPLLVYIVQKNSQGSYDFHPGWCLCYEDPYLRQQIPGVCINAVTGEIDLDWITVP